MVCLVPSTERVTTWGWNDEKTLTGWRASCDSITLSEAETYYLPRDIYESNAAYIEGADDPILELLSSYAESYDDGEKDYIRCIRLWGDKTQGEPYHIYLLGIACLLQNRLGDKIFDSIEKGNNAFERYFPMMCLRLESDDLVKMIIGIVFNDDLYEYCKGLIANDEEEEVKIDEIGDPINDFEFDEF